MEMYMAFRSTVKVTVDEDTGKITGLEAGDTLYQVSQDGVRWQDLSDAFAAEFNKEFMSGKYKDTIADWLGIGE